MISSVHPRVCGEHPLRHARRSYRRFIPACAGNITTSQGATTFGSVHPRVCGEQGHSVHPRVCGEHRLRLIQHRFIPACAGNMIINGVLAALQEVHPRVCGEQHVSSRARQASIFGSSPRVRGTSAWWPLRPSYHRFIPACAGNIKRLLGRRLIPACAGNIPRTRLRYCPTVHPRVCGEHATRWYAYKRGTALPPQVRFIPACAGNISRAVSALPRFIPACAGNIGPIPPTSGRFSVHPRVCGEHIAPSLPTVTAIGSSPRVRGTFRR